MKKLLFVTIFILARQVVYSQQLVFKDGDRVCFIGNSITMAGGFGGYISLFYATRYPERKINFYNTGIAGNVTQNILDRMQEDILIHKPTWGVVMSGMNDAHDYLYDSASDKDPDIIEKRRKNLDLYVNNLEKIIKELLAAKCNVIMETPTVYDINPSLPAVNSIHYNEALKLFASHVKTLATKYHLQVIDYWTILNDLNNEAQKKNSTATIISDDRVHPGPYGHFVMAYQFLKTTQPLSFVSKQLITVSTEKPVCFNCTVSNLKVTSHSVSFISLEHSLPLPLIYQDSLVNFNRELNQEIVKVNGLKKGKYHLRIDGAVVGDFSDRDFKQGINIAQNQATPQYKQADKLFTIFRNYWSTEQILRGMKFLEYSFLTEVKDKENKQEIQKIYDKTMAGYKTDPKPWSGYINSLFQGYFKDKPCEQEYKEKLITLHNQIISLNAPVRHTFIIEKIK